MLTVSLDVHSGTSQMAVVGEKGEWIVEMKVATTRTALAEAVDAVGDPKRVVYEQGPLARLVEDALAGRCEELICSDPSHNALIACAEDASDERDARRLATLAQVDSVRRVRIPPEPYRSLRSLLVYAHRLTNDMAKVKNRIKGVYRSEGVACKGKQVYGRRRREEFRKAVRSGAVRWQLESLYRNLDALALERREARAQITRLTRGLAVVRRLRQIPGVGPVTSQTLVAWIFDPSRFKSLSALSSFGGLGLGQGSTNWKPVGRARASKRGNREVKNVLMIAARAAQRTDTRLGARARARLEAGWDISKVRRDIARTILKIACAMWMKETDYDDNKVSVPSKTKH